jgi:endonuclease G, mitochondrial
MKRRKQQNGCASLVFILLVLVAVAVCYFVFVKKVRIPGVSDFIDRQTQSQKAFTPIEKKSPRDAFAEVGGFPKAVREVDILENTGYATGYSEDLMDPLWSAYYCGPKNVYTVGSREKIAFAADPRIPSAFRVSTSDYKRPAGSSPTYDRGHMAPNYAIASRYGNQAQSETFLMTNIAPQRSTLNQQTWRYLEAEITDTYAPESNGVWVIVGPVFVKSVTRYNGKAAMPDGFFCIILDRDEKTGALRALALYLRQNVMGNHAPKEFVTTIRGVEEHTGLDFFSGLPDEEETALETSAPDAAWHTERLLIDKK